MDQIFLEKTKIQTIGPVISAAVPVDEESQEFFNTIKIGQKFEILPWREKNWEFLKKLHSLLNVVVYRNPKWKRAHFLLKLIQLDIGSVEVGRDFEGKVKIFPKSIAYRAMSQAEFTRLYNDVANNMLANLEMLLPGMSEAEFNSHVMRILEYC